jgi:hypothetical protein
VHFGDPLRDRQTEPGSFRAAGRIELHEAFEDARAIGLRDAGTCVCHPHVDARSVWRNVD